MQLKIIGGVGGGAIILGVVGWLVSGSVVPLVAVAGILLGAGGMGLARRRIASGSRVADPQARETLIGVLVEIGDLLQAVAPANLEQGWNQEQFARVLRRVERLTPAFQSALIDYLAGFSPQRDCLVALLAVDRLSAAYTYWTRLFPPRQGGESMFVLSLLHDLSEKVEYAIELVQSA